ncbi:stage IV sporulation protein FA [Brevibacillus formosus]|uniref:Stage IV sporulation protein FA n=1 Tax=Brevibacillus formosus TaxID=54913 RepID=A0A220MCZ9_9BACL|nr:M23 family metallopeptidase [Brevibacillus formosus]ASJ52858.1 stage IV sporulation protein FA [Brevibacillus formosus]
MFERVDRVKERRRERLERIRTQSRDSYTPYVDDWKDPIEETPNPFSYSPRENDMMDQPPSHEKWGVQILASVLLIGAAYVLFQTTLIPASWKSSAREVMTRDFNFSGVADWYEARFGPIPTMLPSIPTNPPAVPATSTTKEPAAVWKFPSSWKIVRSYDPESANVILHTGMNDQITIGEAGWVAFVGEKPDYGTTVIVRLTKGREIWLGNLDSIGVTKDEVLTPGKVIGTARVMDQSSRHLYVGAKVNEQFVNPLEVIPFE